MALLDDIDDVDENSTKIQVVNCGPVCGQGGHVESQHMGQFTCAGLYG